MSQVEIYNNAPTDPDSDVNWDLVKWGWRYNGIDTGTVFVDRDTAYQDATKKNPGKAVG